jgi:hypothetical protein
VQALGRAAGGHEGEDGMKRIDVGDLFSIAISLAILAYLAWQVIRAGWLF